MPLCTPRTGRSPPVGEVSQGDRGVDRQTEAPEPPFPLKTRNLDFINRGRGDRVNTPLTEKKPFYNYHPVLSVPNFMKLYSLEMASQVGALTYPVTGIPNAS